jgi:hypothetical protein
LTDWRQYEEDIYRLLSGKAEPGAVIDFDVQRPGLLSGTDRQIDVWLEGTLAGGVLPGPVSLAVDCKCWSTTVNVPEVERFLGTLEDVRADIGLLITTTGFSEAARTRARNARGLQLEVMTLQELESWEPEVEFCQVCNDPDDDSDSMPGMFYMEPLEYAPLGERFMVGGCDRCQAIHVRCSCGTLNAIDDFETGGTGECEGCGRPYVVEAIEYDRKAVPVNYSPQLRVRVEAEPPI